MKKTLSIMLISLSTSLMADANPVYTNAAEMAEARTMANQVLNNSQSSKGESVFMDKNSAQTDFTNSSIKIDPYASQNTQQVNPAPAPNYVDYSQADMSNNQQLSKEQLDLLKEAARMRNLKAIQQKFFTKKYSGYENTKHLSYEKDKTEKIRTRFAMATTLIFPNKISSYVLGDKVGFEIEELPNLENAIAIKPNLIGIDTSLTIFTTDKKMYSFYLFSTDYKSNKNPDLIVYVNDKDTQDTQSTQDTKNPKKKDDYFVIKEGIAEIKVKKDEIYANYLQKALKRNSFLLAENIFNDKQFTYFKFDKERMPQIPSIFVVVDGQDSPIETKVIGNYIIAETTATNFTIRLGNAYVCVERLKPNDKRITKQHNSSPQMNKLFEEIQPKTEVKIRKYE